MKGLITRLAYIARNPGLKWSLVVRVIVVV